MSAMARPTQCPEEPRVQTAADEASAGGGLLRISPLTLQCRAHRALYWRMIAKAAEIWTGGFAHRFPATERYLCRRGGCGVRSAHTPRSRENLKWRMLGRHAGHRRMSALGRVAPLHRRDVIVAGTGASGRPDDALAFTESGSPATRS